MNNDAGDDLSAFRFVVVELVCTLYIVIVYILLIP